MRVTWLYGHDQQVSDIMHGGKWFCRYFACLVKHKKNFFYFPKTSSAWAICMTTLPLWVHRHVYIYGYKKIAPGWEVHSLYLKSRNLTQRRPKKLVTLYQTMIVSDGYERMQAKGWVPPALPPIDHSPYIVDLLSVGKVVIIRFQIPIRASRQTFSEQLSLIISSKVLIRNFDTFVFLISVIKGHLYT